MAIMELINVIYVKNLNQHCSVCDVVFDFPRELEDHMTKFLGRFVKSIVAISWFTVVLYINI